jgi:hypothetical protein
VLRCSGCLLHFSYVFSSETLDTGGSRIPIHREIKFHETGSVLGLCLKGTLTHSIM